MSGSTMVLYGNKPEGCWIAESMPNGIGSVYYPQLSGNFFVYGGKNESDRESI